MSNSTALSLAAAPPTSPAITVSAILPTIGRMRLRLLFLCVIGVVLRLTVLQRQRTGQQYAAVDSEAMLQILLVGFTALVLLSCRPRAWIRRLRSTAALWWFAFCLVGLLSTVWSESAKYTLYRSAEVIILSFAVFVIVMSARTWVEAERRMLWLAWIALLAAVIGTSRLYSWSIWGLRSNTYGAMAAMLACYCYGVMLYSRGKRRRNFMVLAGGAAFLTVYSLSLASWWSMLAGVLLITVFSRHRLLVVMLALSGTIAVLVGGETLMQEAILRNRDTEEVGSLHGRRYLWEHYIEAFKERPILGYGFAVGARTTGPVYTTNTHNSLISVLIGCGIIGVLPVFIGIVRMMRDLRLLHRQRMQAVLAISGALLAAGVNSMANAFLGENWTPATFVFCCIFALFLYLYLLWRTNRHSRGMLPSRLDLHPQSAIQQPVQSCLTN